MFCFDGMHLGPVYNSPIQQQQETSIKEDDKTRRHENRREMMVTDFCRHELTRTHPECF